MNKVLIFNFNMFDLEQKALIVDLDTGAAKSNYLIDKIDDAGIVIAKACIDTQITKIHVYGEETYLNDFVIPEFRRYLHLSNYNTENIEVEVN